MWATSQSRPIPYSLIRIWNVDLFGLAVAIIKCESIVLVFYTVAVDDYDVLVSCFLHASFYNCFRNFTRQFVSYSILYTVAAAATRFSCVSVMVVIWLLFMQLMTVMST